MSLDGDWNWNMRIHQPSSRFVPKLPADSRLHGAGVLRETWQLRPTHVRMAVGERSPSSIPWRPCAASGCIGRRWVDLRKVNRPASEADPSQFEMPY